MEYSDYYETKLYPIQNEVLKNLKNLELPFYLTGGTALSRGYYNHRYSDDLDLFVNNNTDFLFDVEKAINTFKKNSFNVNTETMTDSFVRIYLNKEGSGLLNKGLKVDFVNDVEAHFGNIAETNVYYRTDSIRNILSNKYTALYRISAKDIIDICEIANHYKFSWKEIIAEAEQKEAGIDLKEVSEIFRSYNTEAFTKIRWTKHTDIEIIKSNIDKVAFDMLTMNENSLYHQNIKNIRKHDSGWSW